MPAGVLIPDSEHIDGKAFTGMSFDASKVPIDILPIYLIGSIADDFTILIVDEFVRMNGHSEEDIERGRDNLLGVIQRLDRIYRKNTEISL